MRSRVRSENARNMRSMWLLGVVVFIFPKANVAARGRSVQPAGRSVAAREQQPHEAGAAEVAADAGKTYAGAPCRAGACPPRISDG
jgi:hypothetical protein